MIHRPENLLIYPGQFLALYISNVKRKACSYETPVTDYTTAGVTAQKVGSH
jgi:hypothetical protein